MSDTTSTSAETTTGEGTGTESGTTTEETTSTSTETGTETGTDAELGDAGKKAIKAERDARKTAEKDRDAALAEVKRLQRSNAAVKGTDLDAVKEEIRAEFATQLAETAIKAEAKGRLQDPADALLYLKASDVDTSDDTAVTKAIDDLLKARPYLAVTGSAGDGVKPWGDVGGGKSPSIEPEPASPEERMRRAYSKGN
ncbi:hypothetical protein ACFW81_02630 [Streptomyces angustmyceticus]|uniref:hypothetical protein n=1 Tax=Streptomyces angustmyceticus TaxID=285578 RepID=UPI0036C4D595